MDLKDALSISASGMKAQGTRLRVISENLANASSTSQTPGGEPYRRKVLTFGNVLDRTLGAQLVQVRSIGPDRSDFELKYEPSHPAANSDGYVMTPNVNPIIEMADMREAQRSYDANVSVIESSRMMLQRTLEILTS
ncbi:MAG: flagellar basal body rod protein FlgC [Proteobacteria bacterium]|nr:flagellar basal body rod protein FlgC [Pseudomonadota bacterium]